jgi:hypothetical protein
MDFTVALLVHMLAASGAIVVGVMLRMMGV